MCPQPGLPGIRRTALLNADVDAGVAWHNDDGTIVCGFAANRRLYNFSVALAHGDDQVSVVPPDQDQLQSAPVGESLFYVVLSGFVGKRSRCRHASVRIDEHHDGAGVKNLGGEGFLFFVVGRGEAREKKSQGEEQAQSRKH